MSYFNEPFYKCFTIDSSNYCLSRPTISTYNHRLVETYDLYANGYRVGSISVVYGGLKTEVFYSSTLGRQIKIGEFTKTTRYCNPVDEIISNFLKKRF